MLNLPTKLDIPSQWTLKVHPFCGEKTDFAQRLVNIFLLDLLLVWLFPNNNDA